MQGQPRFGSYLGLSAAGFHHLSYAEWGRDDARVVVCAHGLTRNGRDFDWLAAALASHYRVICPDIVGRGRSAYLADPALYGYPQYMTDATALLARLGVGAVDWIGTSMGGLLGLMLAAQPATPIRRLVINDIGPFVPRQALRRIADYVGISYRFSSLVALEAHLRKVHAPFGALTDEQWRHMATHGHVALPDETFRLAYDYAIGERLGTAAASDIDLWPLWERVTCPVMVIRGAQSDVLSAETAQAMAIRSPRVTLVEIPNAGHAPALMTDAEAALIADWLAAD